MSTFEANKRIRIDLILLDTEGNIMEAQVPEYWHRRSKTKLEEDHVYIIKYFEVNDRNRSFRAVDRECIVYFTPHTIIAEVQPVLPTYVLLCGHLMCCAQELEMTVSLQVVFLVSTYVLLCGLHQCYSIRLAVRDQNTPKSGVKRLRNIMISNGLEAISIALWGKHADDFDVERCMSDETEKPIVLLLCALTCRKLNGNLCLHSSMLYRYYINPQIPEPETLRQSYVGQPPAPVWLNHPAAAAVQLETKTVVDFVSIRIPNLIQNQRFTLPAKIKEIQPGQSWWYTACTKCLKSTRDAPDGYKCGNYECNGTKGVARYKLSLRIVDPETDLGDADAPTIQIVFFGPMAQELLGVSVHDLLDSETEVESGLPRKIKELYGKVVTAWVSAGRYALRNPEICLQGNRTSENAAIGTEATKVIDAGATTTDEVKLDNQLSDNKISEISADEAIPPVARSSAEEARTFESCNSESAMIKQPATTHTATKEALKPDVTPILQTAPMKQSPTPITSTEEKLQEERTPSTETKGSTPVPPELKRPCPAKGDSAPTKYRREKHQQEGSFRSQTREIKIRCIEFVQGIPMMIISTCVSTDQCF